MKVLVKKTIGILSLCIYSVVAMENSSLKRSRDEHVPETETVKRYRVLLTDSELDGVVDIFAELYNGNFYWTLKNELQRDVHGSPTEAMSLLRKKVNQLVEKNPHYFTSKIGPTFLFHGTLRPLLKKEIDELIDVIWSQGLITTIDRDNLLIITSENAPVATRRVSFFSTAVKEQQVLHWLSMLRYEFREQHKKIKASNWQMKLPQKFVTTVSKDPYFSVLFQDIQQLCGKEFQVSSQCLVRALGIVLLDYPLLFDESVACFNITYNQLLIVILISHLYLEFERYPEKLILPNHKLIENMRDFPLGDLGYKIYNSEYYCGLNWAPLIPLLLAAKVPHKDLKYLWIEVCRSEILCDYYEELLSTRSSVLKKSLYPLAKSLIDKAGVSHEECLDMSLSFTGVDTSLKVLFSNGLHLSDDIIDKVVRRPFIWDDDTCFGEDSFCLSKNELGVFLKGFSGTMRSLVRHSLVHRAVPEQRAYKASKARVVVLLCSLKRCCPVLPGDVRAKIFSSNAEKPDSLANDVLNVVMYNQYKNYGKTLPYSFDFIKPLIHGKIVEYETLVAILTRAKIERFKTLLSYKNEEEEITPFEFYKTESQRFLAPYFDPEEYFDDEGNTEICARLKSLAQQQEILFMPDKVEENFGALIESSVRDQLKPDN